MSIEIFRDVEQNSEAWAALRRGMVTASMFATVQAKGKGGGESVTRRKYLLTLAGERLSGRTEEGYSNGYMEKGREEEAEARDLYMFKTDNQVEQVGFVRNEVAGYSPDGLIGDDGLLEIKRKIFHLHLECLLSDEVPTEHRAQIQGGLWVSGRKWLDFCSYCKGLPLFVKRVYRDQVYIENLAVEVVKFNDELAALVEKIQPTRAAA